MERVTIENYKAPKRINTIAFSLLGIGAVLMIIGVFLNLDYPGRIWGTLLHNSFYFLALGLAGAFFIASQTIGYNGWFILVRRIHEAMSMVVPVGAVIMLLVFIFGWHDMYHWSHKEIFVPTLEDGSANPKYDKILAGKEPFLNGKVFFILTVIYLVLWSLLTIALRRNSLKSDTNDSIAIYKRSKVLCMVFLVVFGVSSSTAMWHWFMSLEPHWFSTLYGWYCFIGIFVASLAASILIYLTLHKQGYLKFVNESHLHDLGKFMFAFSVAWAYLWFSQFMLIWYGNIPEETGYFKFRLENYPILFYLNFVINFMTPLFILMTAKAKRTKKIVGTMAVILLFGHWLDFYMMTMPSIAKESHWLDAAGHHIYNFGFGFLEIGAPLFFAGLFIFIVFRSLQKASLVPVNHPFIKESLSHQT